MFITRFDNAYQNFKEYIDMRKKISNKLEREILVKNKHCCCICRRDGIGQEVEIHHIDGNNKNNAISNLTVLCLTHHSMADAGLKKGKLGSGRKLKPEEVREHKRIWETKVEQESKIQKQVLSRTIRKNFEFLYDFEIQKVKNEILSLNDKDKRLGEKFDFLDQLALEEALSGLKLRKRLVVSYRDMALLAIERDNLAKRLCYSLWNLFMYLIGPEHVPIKSEDKNLITKSLDVLETLGIFSAEFNSADTLKHVCSTIYDFYEITHLYNLKRNRYQIRKVLEKVRNACDNFKLELNSKTVKQKRSIRKKIVEDTLKKISLLE